ncbi:TBC1 domain protein [Tritrichomonas foetus]|uniref:TBC1 domain protein n=1 Tax=Tritrichomonas foetus TaxID=1144522 RepID=A0A1J4KXP4_9EUKA|nr:TBC1 domain protein [Tritrichomonas foetus]|eukprot:OHT15656.1 TBC1 domain protein [Tritrichomonas foetus]
MERIASLLDIKTTDSTKTILDYVEKSTIDNPIDSNTIKRLFKKNNNSLYERFLTWLVLLEIYPCCSDQWLFHLGKINSNYWSFVRDFGLTDWEKRSIPHHFPSENYGLDNNPTMSLIHGDLVRTGRLLFCLGEKIIPGSQQESDDDKIYFFQEHVRRLERVLYVYAMVNPGFGYLQGFNELVVPFYYVSLSSLSIYSDINIIEAITFQLFFQVMTKTRLNEFYTTQDKSSIILHQLNPFIELQKVHLPDQARIIQDLNIHPIFYCLRWFTLLFAQEYEMEFLIQIWDVLFFHFNEMMEYAFYIGLGQINYVKNALDHKSYQKTITSLQKLKIEGDITPVLNFAQKCWNEDHPPESFFSFLKRKLFS